MIKIVDSGQGVRLFYDEIEVFNHTSLFPFAKSCKATPKYKRKNGIIVGEVDKDSEFQLTDYTIKSASIKSANILFLGYNGSSLLVSVVEEKDKLALRLKSSSKSIKFQLIVGALNDVYVNDNIVNGTCVSNVKPLKIGVLDNPKNNVELIENNSIKLEKITITFLTHSLCEFDMKNRTYIGISCIECPEYLYVTKNQN